MILKTSNRRLLFIPVFFVLNTAFAFAQTDSVNFKKVEWQTRRIAPGIHLKQAWFRGLSLFNANEFISVVEVKPGRKNKLRLAFEPKIKRTTADFGRQSHAIAAVNGTFFDVKNGGSEDFLKVNDRIINNNRLLKDSTRARHQRAALVISDGKLHIAQWDGSSDWEKKLDGQDIMLTGPLLLHDARYAQLDTATFNKARHPRSAIGITHNNRILLVTIDGRDTNSAGVSLFELAKVLRWLHCRDGINLDGGGSTTLWEEKDGVVNYPSDNKKWDHEGQRKVANAVLVQRD